MSFLAKYFYIIIYRRIGSAYAIVHNLMQSAKTIIFAHDRVGSDLVKWILEEYYSDILGIVVAEKNEIYEKSISFELPTHVYSDDDNCKEFIDNLTSKPQLGLLLWWPKIIKEKILNLSSHGFVNTHPSLLPYNRGKNYNFWTLVDETPCGVSLHRVDPGIDTGEVVTQKN